MRIFHDRLELLQSGLLAHDGVCAEVGVDRGKFSSMIVEHTKPKELHLIDAWVHMDSSSPGTARTPPDDIQLERMQSVSKAFCSAIKAGKVVLHQGLSVTILRAFPDAYFDWIYLDGDHSYEGVLADLLAAESKIKPGGHIAGHDFATEDLRPMLTHVFPGVVRAVHEFCQSRGWEIVALTTPSPPGEGSLDPSGNIPSYVLAKR